MFAAMMSFVEERMDPWGGRVSGGPKTAVRYNVETFVGGSDECIEAVLSDPGLEALPQPSTSP